VTDPSNVTAAILPQAAARLMNALGGTTNTSGPVEGGTDKKTRNYGADYPVIELSEKTTLRRPAERGLV
jgi:hypothetical protein